MLRPGSIYFPSIDTISVEDLEDNTMNGWYMDGIWMVHIDGIWMVYIDGIWMIRMGYG